MSIFGSTDTNKWTFILFRAEKTALLQDIQSSNNPFVLA
jgi:hypothetical protein